MIDTSKIEVGDWVKIESTVRTDVGKYGWQQVDTLDAVYVNGWHRNNITAHRPKDRYFKIGDILRRNDGSVFTLNRNHRSLAVDHWDCTLIRPIEAIEAEQEEALQEMADINQETGQYDPQENPMIKPPDLEAFLLDENKKYREAGCRLAEAAMKVVRDYDGIHRLSLAVSDWFQTIADEGKRGDAISEPQEVTLDDLPTCRGGVWDVSASGHKILLVDDDKIYWRAGVTPADILNDLQDFAADMSPEEFEEVKKRRDHEV